MLAAGIAASQLHGLDNVHKSLNWGDGTRGGLADGSARWHVKEEEWRGPHHHRRTTNIHVTWSTPPSLRQSGPARLPVNLDFLFTILPPMNAYRHLQGLGWRGSGFSLDTTDRGLKKPLLISRKSDSRGVGSKTPAARQADHWWLTAYDSALSTLGDKNQVRLSCP